MWSSGWWFQRRRQVFLLLMIFTAVVFLSFPGWFLLGAIALLLLLSGIGGLVLGALQLYVMVYARKWPRPYWLVYLAGTVCQGLDLPIGKKLVIFRDAIWLRYAKEDNVQNKDRVIAYAERIIDRQINKARGVLPFNSLLLATIGLIRPLVSDFSGTRFTFWLLRHLWTLSFVDLILSSILLLELFSVFWGDLNIYKDWHLEFTTSARLSRNRSVVLDVAIILSALSLLSILATVFTVEIFPPPKIH